MLSNKEREVVKLFAMYSLTELKKPEEVTLRNKRRQYRRELKRKMKKIDPGYLRVLRHRIRKKVRQAYYDLALIELADIKMGFWTPSLRDERVGSILFHALSEPGERLEKDEVLDFYEMGFKVFDEDDEDTELARLFTEEGP